MASLTGSKKGSKGKAPAKRLTPAATKASSGMVKGAHIATFCLDTVNDGHFDTHGGFLEPETEEATTGSQSTSKPPTDKRGATSPTPPGMYIPTVRAHMVNVMTKHHTEIDSEHEVEAPPPEIENAECESDSGSSSPSSDDSSSSDSDMPAERITISDGVEQYKINGLPRVTATVLTPHMLRDFEDYANMHFLMSTKKDLTEKRKMRLIAGCFSNKEVMNWIISEAEKQDETVTFSGFVNKLRDHFLDSNWQVQVRRDLMSELMTNEDKYSTWATRVKRKNDVLKNTDCCFDEPELCDFLQNHLCEDLIPASYSADCSDGTKLPM